MYSATQAAGALLERQFAGDAALGAGARRCACARLPRRAGARQGVALGAGDRSELRGQGASRQRPRHGDGGVRVRSCAGA